MRELKTWNKWCYGKAVMTNSQGLPTVFSPNAVFAVEGVDEDTILVYLVDGHVLEGKGTVEEFLADMGERVEYSAKKQAERDAELQQKSLALQATLAQAEEMAQRAKDLSKKDKAPSKKKD